MDTPLHEPADSANTKAQQKFQALELEEALVVLRNSHQQLQRENGTAFSFQGNMLWCNILLTKGRFLNESNYSTLALHKLREIQGLVSESNQSPTFLPYQLLLAQTYYHLGNGIKAREIYEIILKVSQPEQNHIGEIQALNGLAQIAYEENQITIALNFAAQSLELLIQITDEQHFDVLVKNYLIQGQIYLKKGELSQAKNFSDRALSLCLNDNFKELALQSHILLGKTLIALKENVSAINQFLEAKAKSIKINHQTCLAEAILHIGVVFNQVFDYPKALKHFQLVKKDFHPYLDIPSQILLLNSLGKSYLRFHKELEAETYFIKAKKLAQQHGNKAGLVFSLAHLGVIFSIKSEYKKALINAKRVDNLRNQIGDVDGIQVNLINLGNVHNKLEKYSESIKLVSQGIAAAKRMKDGFSEIRGYQIMAEIFRKKKDFKSAVMYQMIYTKFYEDFYQRNDRQQVSEKEHEFAIQQLEKRIAELEKK